jgi:hypothetical protein
VEDNAVTKRDLGSWGKVAATVLPILAAILTTTWALATQANESDQKITRIMEVQKEHADLLNKHEETLRRMPSLEQKMHDLSKVVEENTRLARSLNDTMIRLETRMENLK